jgi:CheY-like chemotaxis protein
VDTGERALKVLVVEDNPLVSGSRARAFEQAGCRVATADSADEAIETLSGAPSFDLVLTDINLRKQDLRDQSGLYLARWISTHHPNVPIVGYSALFQEADIPTDEHPEISRWLFKGTLGMGELRSFIEDAMELGRQARSAREE